MKRRKIIQSLKTLVMGMYNPWKWRKFWHYTFSKISLSKELSPSKLVSLHLFPFRVTLCPPKSYSLWQEADTYIMSHLHFQWKKFRNKRNTKKQGNITSIKVNHNNGC
jgi:hypothetical protein